MTPIEQLRTTLAALNLAAIDARLEGLLESAAKKEPYYADFLLEVMNSEADVRRQRNLKARPQLAHLPYIKTFDQFDSGFQPSVALTAKDGLIVACASTSLPRFSSLMRWGYLPLDDLGATIFFQLVSARYERGSIILTSNKSYGEWGSIFGDPIIATAILDRLLHHSTTINIRGES